MVTKQPSGPAAAQCAALGGTTALTLAGLQTSQQPCGGWSRDVSWSVHMASFTPDYCMQEPLVIYTIFL